MMNRTISTRARKFSGLENLEPIVLYGVLAKPRASGGLAVAMPSIKLKIPTPTIEGWVRHPSVNWVSKLFARAIVPGGVGEVVT